MKKVNKDPFSNGSHHCDFYKANCNKCIKSSEPRISEEDGLTYYTNQREDGLPKCSIQRDIGTRMYCREPIKQKTIDICRNFTLNGVLCPYLRTERKRYAKKQDKNQLNLFQL